MSFVHIKKIFDDAGCKLERCSQDFGGSFAYTTADNPNCKVCGYKTADAAIEEWFFDTFGKKAGMAVLSMLEDR